MRSLNINPTDKSTVPGSGGPEDDPNYPHRNLATHGLVATAFGIALGIAMVIISLILKQLTLSGPLADILNAYSTQTLWLDMVIVFVSGFVGGTILAFIYNLLVVKRLSLFGTESNLN